MFIMYFHSGEMLQIVLSSVFKIETILLNVSKQPLASIWYHIVALFLGYFSVTQPTSIYHFPLLCGHIYVIGSM